MRWAAMAGLCLTLTASASGPNPPRLEAVAATARREALGRALFFDLSLSADGRVGCMTCHLPERVFSDRDARSLGAHLRVGTRNAPSLLDVAEARTLFWDGRRTSLEALILDPLLHPQEHALPSAEELVVRVRNRHAAAHALAFPDEEVSARTITGSIAAYVRTLKSGESAFARFHFGKDSTALDEAQRRGHTLFIGRAGCARCHTAGPKAAPFTDGAFHAGVLPKKLRSRLPTVAREVAKLSEAERFSAVASREEVAALGRFVVSLRPEDIGRFRTPSLRNAALTAPYMHDGSVPTLSEAVAHELNSRVSRRTPFTPRDHADLVAFVEALTSASFSELGHTEVIPNLSSVSQ
ncbi:cytochrome-c peroxidase [Myxococcus eversor]|uniref:cytochrome-c peroxidase n=1 Tax=Myxococcus eversor TaxID=2709661 RepID=UPI0013CFBFA2|nr:cytochrome c peroxidase [Myxococcus eversor]